MYKNYFTYLKKIAKFYKILFILCVEVLLLSVGYDERRFAQR